MEDELSLLMEEQITQEQKEFLYNRVEELKCSNATLLAENDMFERFISRIDPQDLVSPVGGDSLGAAGASQLEDGGRARSRRSRSSISDRLHQLTLEQKIYVARREITETQQDQAKRKQRDDQIQNNYKASLKEADLRLAEIRRSQAEFEHRLLKPMKDNRLEMKEPDKVLQYIEERSKVTQLEKLNLKNRALRAHEKKLQQQLQQKKETGKAEYQTELFQDYSEKRIEKKLAELQVNSLEVQRVLTSHKEKLQSVILESIQLSNDISNRKQMLSKIEEEIRQAEEERLKAETLNQHLCRQMTDYQAPDIIEYMHVKEKHKKLQQSVRTWERKVGVAQMALKTHAKAWNTQRATVTPAYSAEAGARSGGRQLPVKLPYIAEHGTWRKNKSGKADWIQ